MRVRYYVRPFGDQFQVLREGKPQGRHDGKRRAIESAIFMATIEAGKQGEAVELFVEDDAGRLVQEQVIAPDDVAHIEANGLCSA
jgi:hypothetical protein